GPARRARPLGGPLGVCARRLRPAPAGRRRARARGRPARRQRPRDRRHHRGHRSPPGAWRTCPAMTRPALLLLFAAATVTACGSTPPSEPAAADNAPSEGIALTDEAARTAGIETEVVRAVDRTDRLRAAGVVAFDERRTARLGSLVDGIVAEVTVQPGDAVRAGAVLARLHSHVVHDAWAAYFKAMAARERAAAELAYARTAESRAATLVADRALSPQELERARADLSAATQAEVAARAEVGRAEQELRHYGLEAKPG